jgi:hypothetical protein
MDYTIVNGELHHHGIKGQRWGVRRFQTKSGSLTSAGKKRYGVGKGDSKKKTSSEPKDKAKKTESVKSGKDKQKTVVEIHEDYAKTHSNKQIQSMSDNELRSAINRLTMENQYKQLNPPKKSLGKKFLDEFVMPAAKEIGKEYVKKYMKEGAKYLDEYLNSKASNTKTPSKK